MGRLPLLGTGLRSESEAIMGATPMRRLGYGHDARATSEVRNMAAVAARSVDDELLVQAGGDLSQTLQSHVALLVKVWPDA